MSEHTFNSSVTVWFQSFRPKTLLLALSSMITGIFLAYWKGYMNISISCLLLITAFLLQIISNLANDYGDAIKGSDTHYLKSKAKRGLLNGQLSLLQIKRAITLLIILATLSGLLLIYQARINISYSLLFLILGIFSIVASVTYTVGKNPYGYFGLGDIAVFIFFGLIAVVGAEYLLTKQFTASTLLPASGIGLLSSAVLNINNIRDLQFDRQNGKNTLAVKLGEQAARSYHAVLLFVALVCLVLFSAIYQLNWTGWLFLLTTPFIVRHMRYIKTHYQAEELEPMLGNMVKIAFMTNLLFVIGLYYNR